MKGHGWVGLRFQLDEFEDYNEIVLHVKFNENDATLQQETLGSLGVNLIYGAFNYSDNPRRLIESLYDDISTDNVAVSYTHLDVYKRQHINIKYFFITRKERLIQCKLIYY